MFSTCRRWTPSGTSTSTCPTPASPSKHSAADSVLTPPLSSCQPRSLGFVALLEAACHANSSAITPIGGAAQILRAVAEQGWGVAIATGAWRRAAEFKLAVAGVDCTDVPLATSEDGPARAAIIANARSLAEQRHGVDRFFRLVSVGDATWDVRAARVLNIPFVGVGSGVRAERLHAAGARVVLEDFSDRARTFDALEQADVPG